MTKKPAPCLGRLLSEEDPEENPMPYALLAAALVAVDQLVKYMRNSQDRQQPVNDQLVHALMPNDAACFIEV